MRGGTYAVYRRISVDLGSWDAQTLAAQQHAVGRYKGSGAYLGERTESDPINLEATDAHGDPVIPATSHVRLASANANSGMIILRRSYSFSDSATRADGTGLDSGLLFCAYQRDPRNGFVAIYSTLAGHDGLSAFTTHTGSAIVAVPPAAPGPGAWVGQTLFEA
jgi:deferrochelatase/peroxidase EfeB